VKYAFVRDHVDQFPVELTCEVLEVTRSGYYAWKRRPPGTKEVRRGELVAQIRKESRATYGSPRVHRELEARGIKC
jgi:putative transposase